MPLSSTHKGYPSRDSKDKLDKNIDSAVTMPWGGSLFRTEPCKIFSINLALQTDADKKKCAHQVSEILFNNAMAEIDFIFLQGLKDQHSLELFSTDSGSNSQWSRAEKFSSTRETGHLCYYNKSRYQYVSSGHPLYHHQLKFFDKFNKSEPIIFFNMDGNTNSQNLLHILNSTNFSLDKTTYVIDSTATSCYFKNPERQVIRLTTNTSPTPDGPIVSRMPINVNDATKFLNQLKRAETLLQTRITSLTSRSNFIYSTSITKKKKAMLDALKEEINQAISADIFNSTSIIDKVNQAMQSMDTEVMSVSSTCISYKMPTTLTMFKQVRQTFYEGPDNRREEILYTLDKQILRLEKITRKSSESCLSAYKREALINIRTQIIKQPLNASLKQLNDIINNWWDSDIKNPSNNQETIKVSTLMQTLRPKTFSFYAESYSKVIGLQNFLNLEIQKEATAPKLQ